MTLLCLLTDIYYNILIQRNGMNHIKFTSVLTFVNEGRFKSLLLCYFDTVVHTAGAEGRTTIRAQHKEYILLSFHFRVLERSAL